MYGIVWAALPTESLPSLKDYESDWKQNGTASGRPPCRLGCKGTPLHRGVRVGREEGVGRLLEFFRTHVLQVLGEPPFVAEWIFETPGPISPELVDQGHDFLATGVERPLPGGVNILQVDKEADGTATIRLGSLATLLRHFVGQHDGRIAHADLGVHDLAVGPGETPNFFGAQRV